ncbi:hypothetical protein GGI25_005067 [Coemansia spiralis]|uniref:TLC domain-containing protein n=1 Tax=Coemansia spiralis TaxID=417178 RepID=A0A9W8G3A1_9FUNG|nr:hypothetical protein BX070DRAFT_226375 [Coemansia spiralis]KAJ2672512.1 hypothetical protein GGI25_005067 [Coemansia spiralis]
MPLLPIPFSFVAGAAVGSLGLNALFHAVRRKRIITTEKQLAWVLTFATCVVVTLGSIKYVLPAFSHGFDVTQLVLSDPFSLVLLGFFFSYLVWDLVLGILYYRSTIAVLTGYIHHLFYIGLSVFAAKRGVSAIFCLLFYNELPTIFLALGSLRKEWRSDTLFAITFFSTRIALHTMLLMEFFQHSEIRFLWKIMFLVLPMHLYWFYGAMRVQVRKHAHNTL